MGGGADELGFAFGLGDLAFEGVPEWLAVAGEGFGRELDPFVEGNVAVPDPVGGLPAALMPPLVRRALRARRPVPSKLVLARGGADRIVVTSALSAPAPRCARVEGTGLSPAGGGARRSASATLLWSEQLARLHAFARSAPPVARST